MTGQQMHGREGFHPVWLTKQRKMLISGGLTVCSVVLALLARSFPCYLAAIAMMASSLGDALLAGYPESFAEVKNKLTKGAFAFFAAHILYICALLCSYGKDVLALLPHFVLPFTLFLILTALHGTVFYSRSGSAVSPAFFAAAFFYLLTVGIHAAASVTVYGQAGGGYLLNSAGAILFYLSDATLLARRYGAIRGKYITALIWLTYVPAQFCLMLGIYLMRTVPA